MQSSNPFKELQESIKNLHNEVTLIKDCLDNNLNKKQIEFYTPKEFAHLTSTPYSTVVSRCSNGKIKARQDEENCSWKIDKSELERYKKEASDNIF